MRFLFELIIDFEQIEGAGWLLLVVCAIIKETMSTPGYIFKVLWYHLKICNEPFVQFFREKNFKALDILHDQGLICLKIFENWPGEFHYTVKFNPNLSEEELNYYRIWYLL